VKFCHQHNLVQPETAGAERKYGIRVSLPTADTIAQLLGSDWERMHWYASEEERDSAYENMVKRHGYYRSTDNPSQVLEKIVR
jgi:hypothetical protein